MRAIPSAQHDGLHERRRRCTASAAARAAAYGSLNGSTAPRMIRLSKVGANADSAKRPAVFSTPENSDAIAMPTRYGMVICVSSMARLKCSGSLRVAGVHHQHDPRHGDLRDDAEHSA